jgi:hypothetical protein
MTQIEERSDLQKKPRKRSTGKLPSKKQSDSVDGRCCGGHSKANLQNEKPVK